MHWHQERRFSSPPLALKAVFGLPCLRLRRVHCFPSWQPFISRNQPGAALVSEIRPRPLDQHNQAIAKPDQEEDMNEQPGQPGQKTGDVDLPELRDGGGPTNRGKTSL